MGRLAIPPAPAYSSWSPDEGTRHAGEAPSGLVVVMLVGGREASRGIITGERFYPLCTVRGISHSKKSSYRVVLTPSKVMMLFKRVPHAW
jgi:hypothetical protein